MNKKLEEIAGLIADNDSFDEEQAYRTAKIVFSEYLPKIATAYTRWLNENCWLPWNEIEWYSECEDTHLVDEELFNKFLEEYENYTCHR